jgi:hypothetical protein
LLITHCDDSDFARAHDGRIYSPKSEWSFRKSSVSGRGKGYGMEVGLSTGFVVYGCLLERAEP